MPRAAKRGENVMLRGKTLKERNLENVDFLLVFTIYSAMSHLGEPKKNEERACTAGLPKRTENASARSAKNGKKGENLKKNDEKTEFAQKGAFRH